MISFFSLSRGSLPQSGLVQRMLCDAYGMALLSHFPIGSLVTGREEQK
jgi:hypothetical protein